MIKTNFGETTIEGTGDGILTDYTIITRELRKVMVEEFGVSEENAKEMIQNSFELAFKPMEQVKKESVEMLKKLMENKPDILLDLLVSIFEGKRGGEE